jgi:hypothetical protein
MGLDFVGAELVGFLARLRIGWMPKVIDAGGLFGLSRRPLQFLRFAMQGVDQPPMRGEGTEGVALLEVRQAGGNPAVDHGFRSQRDFAAFDGCFEEIADTDRDLCADLLGDAT